MAWKIIDSSNLEHLLTGIQNKFATKTDVNNKMNKINPTGTGSFSLNRKANTTIGNYSFSEGCDTVASGFASHAEGEETTANGMNSHTEGWMTKALADCSHAEGFGTIANNGSSHVEGTYNIVDTKNKYVHIVGNGEDEMTRSNAHTLDWNGNAWYAGDVTVGADNKKLATLNDVDNKQDKTDNNLTTIDKTVIGAINELKTNFQVGVDGIYNAIVAEGTTPTSKSQSDVETGIGALSTNRYNDGVSNTKKGNASEADVLSGKTFTNSSKVNTTGTMTNNGAVNASLNTSTTSYTVPKGYHSGSGTVKITTQTKTATPGTSAQTIKPDTGKVLSSVTVNAMSGGSLNNAATTGVTYVENTDDSTVIPSEGALYINAGYFPNTKITLGHMIPDPGTSETNPGTGDIRSGYVAYDKDGKKIVGTIANVSPAFTGGTASLTGTSNIISTNMTTDTSGTYYIDATAKAKATRTKVTYNGAATGYIDKASGTTASAANTSAEGSITATRVYIPTATSSKTDGTVSATASAGTASVTTDPTASASLTRTGSIGTTTKPSSGTAGTDYWIFTSSASANSGVITATGGSAQAKVTASSASVGAGYNPSAITVSTSAKDSGLKTGATVTTTAKTASDNSSVYLSKAVGSVTMTAGDGSVSGSNVTLSDTNNGISITGKGSVSATAKITTAGYTPTNNNFASGSSTSSNSATKYITGITVPKDQTFSLVTTADTALDTTSNVTITNNAYRQLAVTNKTYGDINITNSGQADITTGSSSVGAVTINAYDNATTPALTGAKSITSKGKWVRTSLSATSSTGTYYGAIDFTKPTQQAAKTITPSESSQTAVSSGTYCTGAITVAAIPSEYVKPTTTKTATTYNTSTSNQTIAAGTYCSGTQTIRGVTTSNIEAENIKKDVVVQVGDAKNSGRIKNITGTLDYLKTVKSVPTTKDTSMIYNSTNGIYYVWKE